MASDNKASYRSIFKATSLFGGVQLYKILISVIKSKFVAILLGPFGMGIQGLLVSSADLVKQLTSMGLARSGVRDVAEANGFSDFQKIARTVTVVRRLVWWTGLLGLSVVLFLSPVISKITFGNYDYTLSFALLSITLLLDQLNAGQMVILQGMRRLKDLAKASVIGVTVGLFVSVPLYYWLGVKGIVPTLIIHSATSLLLSWIYSRRVKVENVEIPRKEVLHDGSTMLRMGIAMSISSILMSLSAYVLRWFIRSYGGTEVVGLYSAGFAILTTYVGMIFSAISTDYYPRLAGAQSDNEKCNEIVNQQGEIATCILGPILTVCLFFMPWVIKILYSDKFLPANYYILWAAIGILFKLGSWLISYQFVAKGESKLFIKLEVSANIYMLVLNIAGYYLKGLAGLGLSFTVGYLIYFVQIFVIAKNKYSFGFTYSFRKIYFLYLSVLSCSLVLLFLTRGALQFVFSAIVIIFAFYYALRELNSRLDLMALLRKIMSR